MYSINTSFLKKIAMLFENQSLINICRFIRVKQASSKIMKHACVNSCRTLCHVVKYSLFDNAGDIFSFELDRKCVFHSDSSSSVYSDDGTHALCKFSSTLSLIPG